MSLQEELDKIRPVIRTDDYSMSIGELSSLYEKRELDIHPEFQRFYRWDEYQKTRFIESVMLGIPIPPIFVSQRDDGVWDVVDGLQRLSTIFQFMGILKDSEGKIESPLVLEKTKHLPSLEGKLWESTEKPENSFDVAQRLYLKRSKLHVSIILRESSEFAKYELFQRINSGGSKLSDQEMRNCILVQKNPQMYRWLDELAHHDNFIQCTELTEKAIDERYDQELVLRFITLCKVEEKELSNVGDVGEYLMDMMVKKADNKGFNYDEEAQAFKTTFDILHDAIGENSFRRYDPKKQKYVGGFLITPFEVIALGIGYNYRNPLTIKEYEPLIKRFWTDDISKLRAGSGIRASTRIPDTVPYGRALFSK
jgi:hypothetical protein